MNNLSVSEVIEGLTDWIGDGVNSIYEEAMYSSLEVYDEHRDSYVDDISSYRIVVETTDGLKPSWMPTEIGCYQIVVRQGGPYKVEAGNGQ